MIMRLSLAIFSSVTLAVLVQGRSRNFRPSALTSLFLTSRFLFSTSSHLPTYSRQFFPAWGVVDCESIVHGVYRTDHNHNSSSRMRALLLHGFFSSFLRRWVANGRPRHSQFPYAPASFSEFGKHYSYVALGKNHFILKPLPAPNVIFDLRSGGSSLSVRVLASTPMLGIPLDTGCGACSLRGTPVTVLVVLTILCRWRFVLSVSTLLLCHLL